MPLITNFRYSDANLARAQAEQGLEDTFTAPSYFRAADTHNIANGNPSYEDSFMDTVVNLPKFIVASMVSGVNQVYNIAPSIGNALGGEFDISDTASVMQALDGDLAKYYESHHEGVDTLGFMVSSLIPGVRGIKVLNAGQKALTTAIKSGRFGPNMSSGLKLLAPQRENLVAKAVKEVINSDNPFRLRERNLVKAMGAGFGQNILEAVAFETAVAATMFDSPILKEQDLGDLVTNIAFGGVVFGALGGVVDATRSAFKVRGSIKAADAQAKPWQEIHDVIGGSPSDNIISYFDQHVNMPAVPKEFGVDRVNYLESSATKTKSKLMERARTEFAVLTGSDQELADLLFQQAKLKGARKVLEDHMGTVSTTRLADTSKAEKAYNSVAAKVKSKPADVTPEELTSFSNTAVTYTRHYGDEAGNITTTPPTPLHIIDTMKKGDTISINPTGVRVGDELFKFKQPVPDYADSWNVAHSTVMEADARRVWANSLPPFKDGHIIGHHDLPLLEKMYREFSVTHKVKLEDGNLLSFVDREDFFAYLRSVKDDLAHTIMDQSSNGIYFSSAEAMATKLRQITGIRFEVAPTGRMMPSIVGDFSLATGRIRLNEAQLTRMPLHKLLDTLKHEEGHSVFNVLLDVGGVPKPKHAAMHAELEAISRKQRPGLWATADKTGDYRYVRFSNNVDTTAQAASHELMADTFAYLSKYPKEGQKLAPTFMEEFGHLLRPIDEKIVAQYIKKSQLLSQEELASMLNVRNSYLSGEVSANPTRDYFAMESYSEEYTKKLVDQKVLKEDAPLIDLYRVPQHSKTIVDKTPVKDLDGHVLEGMALITQKSHLYMESVNTAIAGVLGAEAYAKLIALTMSDIQSANRMGAGPGLAAAASANYGTLASKVEFIGNIVSGLKDDARKAVSELLNAPLYKMTQNVESAIEWSVLNNRLRGIEDAYTLTDDGAALIPSVFKRYNALLAAGKTPKPPTLKTKNAPMEIPLVNQEVRNLAKIHIEQNGATRRSQQQIRNAQGVEHHVDADAFYPIPVDPRDFPFFATVTDSTITGTGHTRSIYANSQRELDEMIRKLDGTPGLEIRTKGEAEAYWKSIGQFDYDKTLHDNFLDSAMRRQGASMPYYAPTDPHKIVNDVLKWHSDRSANLVLEAVSAKYEDIFSTLKNLGETYTNLATSRTGSLSVLKHADEVVENPYMDYVKTALGIRNYSDYPFWTSANRALEGKVSQMYKDITRATEGARTPEELSNVNRILTKYGYKGAAYTEDMELLANHTAPKAALTSFIQKSNALLATVVLRLDTLNAINNTVGANVLLGSEAISVIRAIERGDANAVGELAKLAKIKVPGQDKLMLSPAKLIANSMKRFGTNTPEMQFYRDNRFISSISDQYRWVVDELTLAGQESVKDLGSKITRVQESLRKAADTGEKWTGNRLAEEFNRFVAADVMKQITDIAVKHGAMDSKTALSYINTFVNRTQGNYLASQRPMMFQGPIGQAIGLFQTYQFNLMQQLLRHVGEGRPKDYMTLLGLQGTIYGMNGLPAFNAINTHLIGTASGNKEHTDTYDAVYGSFGKEAGDWLMYGVASNMMLHPDAKVNLYTRGDINPRHVTIVPTNPADVPIYGATVKFMGNLFNTAKKLSSGGDVSQTLLQGLEHNGLSRPLAGLAQTLQGMDNPYHSSYSTSNRGNVVASNDLVSLANLTRLVGGKPLGEAIAVDAAFRMRAYAASDTDKKETLGASIKSTLIAGNSPTAEQMDAFTEEYVKLGGKQTEFNKWVVQLYKAANTSQVNDIMRHLDTPYSKTMQKLMGGYEMRDFHKE